MLKRSFDHSDVQHARGSPQKSPEEVRGPPGHNENVPSLNLHTHLLAPVAKPNHSDHLGLENTSSVNGDATTHIVSATQPEKPTNKRRKLTSDEIEARRVEKEEKDRQRAEEKVKKETEKEEKRKVKDAQTKLKEDEKMKKEEERHKKEKVWCFYLRKIQC